MSQADFVTREMRNRLLRNREGRLTVDQWKEMIVEPIVKLLLLLLPAFVVLLPRLALLGRGLVVVLLIIVLVIVLPVPFRAWRYARVPLHFAVLYAGQVPKWWQFWKPLILYTKEGNAIQFQKSLTSKIRLKPHRAYLLYYFEDPGNRVLLSIAPSDHPDTDQWKPTPSVQRNH